MRTKRMIATQEVASQLFAAENAIDIAIAEAAKLSALLPQARVLANLSAVVGQDALLQSGSVLQRLIEARSNIVETHASLDVVKGEIGLRAMGMGGAMNKGSADRHLEVVAKSA